MAAGLRDADTLLGRLVLGFGALVLVLVLIGVGVGTTFVNQQIEADEERIAGTLAEVVASSVNRVAFSGRYHARLLLQEYVERNPAVVYLRILEDSGDVWAEAGPRPDPGTPAPDEQRVVDAWVDGEPVREVIVPFRGGPLDEQIGTIRIGVSRAPGAARLRRNLAILLALGVAVGGIALLAVVRASRRLAAPVQSLAEEFAALLANTSLGVAIEDRSGVLVRTSDRLGQLLGVEGSTEGRTFVDLVGPEVASRFAAHEPAPVSSGGEPLRFEALVPGDDGARTLVFRRFGLGQQRGYVCTLVSDITEQRSLERALLQSRRMETVGQFAGGVAHDFNNILTGVAGLTDGIEQAKDPRDVAEQADQLRQLVRMGSELTARLLSFGRKQVTVVQPHDLNDIVRDVQGFLGRIVREDVVIQLDLGAEPLPVEVDRGQVEQVLMNLVANARDAIDGAGRIVVRSGVEHLDAPRAVGSTVLQPGPYARMEVQDDGGGIPASIRESLFDPFATTKDLGKGTGLGLSIVYGIVSRHEGAIEFQTGPAGTTFIILLPLVGRERLPDPPSLALPVAPGEQPRCLLLIEDNDFVRKSLAEALGRRGYEVVAECDGPSGLDRYTSDPGRWDVVLLDVVMPGMNGGEVAQAIKEMEPAARILFMTGYDDDILREYLDDDPAVGFVQKPFTPAQLSARVEQLVAQG